MSEIDKFEKKYFGIMPRKENTMLRRVYGGKHIIIKLNKIQAIDGKINRLEAQKRLLIEQIEINLKGIEKLKEAKK